MPSPCYVLAGFHWQHIVVLCYSILISSTVRIHLGPVNRPQCVASFIIELKAERWLKFCIVCLFWMPVPIQQKWFYFIFHPNQAFSLSCIISPPSLSRPELRTAVQSRCIRSKPSSLFSVFAAEVCVQIPLYTFISQINMHCLRRQFTLRFWLKMNNCLFMGKHQKPL